MNFQHGQFGIGNQGLNVASPLIEQTSHCAARHVAAAEPDNERWWTTDGRQLIEVRVERHDHETVLPGELPDRQIIRALEPKQLNVTRPVEYRIEFTLYAAGQVLVEQQLQARNSGRAGRHRALIALGRKRETGANVLELKFREVSQNVGLAHALGQPGKHIVNRDPHAADARLAAAFPGFQRDAIAKFHRVLPVERFGPSVGRYRSRFQRIMRATTKDH